MLSKKEAGHTFAACQKGQMLIIEFGADKMVTWQVFTSATGMQEIYFFSFMICKIPYPLVSEVASCLVGHCPFLLFFL